MARVGKRAWETRALETERVPLHPDHCDHELTGGTIGAHHVPSTTGEMLMAKQYGQQPNKTHAKGQTYPGTRTTAKLKAEGKITAGDEYDKSKGKGK